MKRSAAAALLFAALLILPAPARSLDTTRHGDWVVRFTGYFKNTVAYTEDAEFPTYLLMGVPPDRLPPFVEEKIGLDEHTEDLTRLRLRLNGRKGGTCAWELHYELRGLAADPDVSLPTFSAQAGASGQLLDMEAVTYDEPGYVMRHMVDRAWFRWTPGWGEFVVGRQAITWTVGRLWFPTDLFGPFLPFDIEQDEKKGVDAVNAAINLGALSSIRLIYAPLDEREDDRVGARFKASLGGFELHAMWGYFSGDRVAGGSMAHNLFGAVARVEGAYTHPLDGDDRWSMVANVDAGLPKNMYVAVEYYHQSEGEVSKENYWRSAPLYYGGKIYGMARDYIGLIYNWQATALVRPGLTGVMNLSDSSLFVAPRVEWKAARDVTVAAAANLFVSSGAKSEFGGYPDSYYSYVKVYF